MKTQVQHIKLWDAAKAILRRKVVTINASIKKEKKKNRQFYISKNQKKKEQIKPRVGRRKKISF